MATPLGAKSASHRTNESGFQASERICAACLADHGFCLYCQITYQRPMSLHRHIAKVHPDTIRAENCDG